jgi:hypothetical protein
MLPKLHNISDREIFWYATKTLNMGDMFWYITKTYQPHAEDETRSWNYLMALVIAGLSCGFIDASLETGPKGD